MEKYSDDLYAKEIGRKDEEVANHRKERSITPRTAMREEAGSGSWLLIDMIRDSVSSSLSASLSIVSFQVRAAGCRIAPDVA
jgi:hypothetical protein